MLKLATNLLSIIFILSGFILIYEWYDKRLFMRCEAKGAKGVKFSNNEITIECWMNQIYSVIENFDYDKISNDSLLQLYPGLGSSAGKATKSHRIYPFLQIM